MVETRQPGQSVVAGFIHAIAIIRAVQFTVHRRQGGKSI